MTNKLNNTIDSNKIENKKTFKEIKIALKELLHDTKRENKTKEKRRLIQKSKQKIEENIIKNLNEGLKISSGDFLYPLNYLTTYETTFTSNKKAEKIFPGDILKLEGNDLIILRQNKKIIIGTIYKIEEVKKSTKIIESNILNEVNELAEKIKEEENNNKNIEINDNTNFKKIFNDFFEKAKIPFLTKSEILELTNNDYIKAITILLIYSDEQGQKSGFPSRQYIKQQVRKIEDYTDVDIIKSKGIWQIRPNSIGTEKLKYFFNQKINSNFLNNKDQNLFNKLKNNFLKNKKLNYKEKVELVENKKLATLLVNSIITIDKNRINSIIKKIWNIDILNKKNLSEKEIFFITTKLADSYHLGPKGAIIGGLFTDNSLKIAEKLGILEKDGKILANTEFGGQITNSYQVKIRTKHKGIINNLLGKTNFYKRNTEIQKETIKRIIEYLEKNEKENYNIKELKTEAEKRINGYVPKKIIELINNLNKKLNFSILDITANDYKKSNPEEAMLVGNYGTRAWRNLIK